MAVTVLARSLGLGAGSRSVTPGPEQELVEWFLREHRFRVGRGREVMVFREPRMESGFPDLVFAVWRPSVAKHWPASRADLRPHDLRVAQHLVTEGPGDISELAEIFPRRSLDRSLRRLRSGEMVRGTLAGRWSARPISKIFAVERLVAVEAKIDKWHDALNQAALNRWFASESYLLLPRLTNHGLVAAAEQHSIGVWARDKGVEPFVRPDSGAADLPRSYGSWLFNEWVWRSKRTRLGEAR